MPKVPIKPGIHFDIGFDEYITWDAFNQSSVRSMIRSPAHYQAYQRSPNEPSKAQILGSALDSMISLHDPDFKKRYSFLPPTYEKEVTTGRSPNKVTVIKEMPFTLNSNTCKEIVANAASSGQTLLPKSDWDKLAKMRDSLLANNEISAIIESAKKQVAIVWRDITTGVLCKGLIDFLGDEISDLKTTKDAGYGAFSRAIDAYGYHIQGAFYSDGLKALNGGKQLPVNLLAVESSDPFGSVLYSLQDQSLLVGRFIYKQALCLYKECCESEQWPCYSKCKEPIEIPEWSIKKEIPRDCINSW